MRVFIIDEHTGILKPLNKALPPMLLQISKRVYSRYMTGVSKNVSYITKSKLLFHLSKQNFLKSATITGYFLNITSYFCCKSVKWKSQGVGTLTVQLSCNYVHGFKWPSMFIFRFNMNCVSKSCDHKSCCEEASIFI